LIDERYVVAISYEANLVQVLNRTTGEHIWNASAGVKIAAEPLLYEDYLIIAVNEGGSEDIISYNVTNGCMYDSCCNSRCS
jgi:outer membrane protein assembly factor BamB